MRKKSVLLVAIKKKIALMSRLGVVRRPQNHLLKCNYIRPKISGHGMGGKMGLGYCLTKM